MNHARNSEISALVKRSASEAGFDLAGIAPAADSRELQSFPEWIAAGHAGEMKYMESRVEQGSL
jgi:epoxyqueuosine reductase QueG